MNLQSAYGKHPLRFNPETKSYRAVSGWWKTIIDLEQLAFVQEVHDGVFQGSTLYFLLGNPEPGFVIRYPRDEQSLPLYEDADFFYRGLNDELVPDYEVFFGDSMKTEWFELAKKAGVPFDWSAWEASLTPATKSQKNNTRELPF